MAYQIGDKVGAMLCQKDGIISFLGYGKYLGDEPVPEEIDCVLGGILILKLSWITEQLFGVASAGGVMRK